MGIWAFHFKVFASFAGLSHFYHKCLMGSKNFSVLSLHRFKSLSSHVLAPPFILAVRAFQYQVCACFAGLRSRCLAVLLWVATGLVTFVVCVQRRRRFCCWVVGRPSLVCCWTRPMTRRTWRCQSLIWGVSERWTLTPSTSSSTGLRTSPTRYDALATTQHTYASTHFNKPSDKVNEWAKSWGNVREENLARENCRLFFPCLGQGSRTVLVSAGIWWRNFHQKKKKKKKISHRQLGPLRGSSSPFQHFEPARVKPN